MQVLLILWHYDTWHCQESLFYKRKNCAHMLATKLEKVQLLEGTLSSSLCY